MKNLIYVLVFSLFSIFFVNNAKADEQILSLQEINTIVGMPKEVLENVKSSIDTFSSKISKAAKYIFGIACIFSLVFVGTKMLFGEANFQTFAVEMIKMTLFCSACYAVISYGSIIIIECIESFAKMFIGGSQISESDDVLTIVINLAIKNLEDAGIKISSLDWTDFGAYLIISLVAIFVTLCFFIMLFNYICIYIKMYFVMTAGTIAVAMGGFTHYNQYALNYLKMAFIYALQLMATILMIIFLNDFCTNYIYSNNAILSGSFNNTILMIINAGFIGIFARVAMELPNAISSLIDSSGASHDISSNGMGAVIT